MIPLKTIPPYSLVFTALSEEAVDIRPPILVHCFVCKRSCLSDSHAAHKYTSFCWWGSQWHSSVQFPAAPPASQHFLCLRTSQIILTCAY